MRTVEQEKKHQAMLAGMTGLVLMLNASLCELDRDERVELLNEFMRGYCHGCGSDVECNCHEPR